MKIIKLERARTPALELMGLTIPSVSSTYLKIGYSDNFSGAGYKPHSKIWHTVFRAMFSMWFNTKFVRVPKLLAKRSKIRFRSKLLEVHRTFEASKISEAQAQQQATALTAFVAKAYSKKYRKSFLQTTFALLPARRERTAYCAVARHQLSCR